MNYICTGCGAKRKVLRGHVAKDWRIHLANKHGLVCGTWLELPRLEKTNEVYSN
jgi:hypothetical protein